MHMQLKVKSLEMMERRIGKDIISFRIMRVVTIFFRNDGAEKQGWRKPIICRYCGGENHMEKLCLKKKDNERKQNKPKKENFKDGKKDRYNFLFVAIFPKREDKTCKDEF